VPCLLLRDNPERKRGDLLPLGFQRLDKLEAAVSDLPSSGSDARLPFLKSISWVCPKSNSPREYRIGLSKDGQPVRFDVLGAEKGKHVLVIAWRTVSGEWVGKYRSESGYKIARLKRSEIELIEKVAKLSLSRSRARP
jgi:hypothetical protein